MLILIADDDPGMAATLARVFRAKGYDVLECTDGAGVLHLIEQRRPTAVFLDLAMPQMNGFDIAEELQDHADLRPKLLVAITGYGYAAVKAECMKVGFDHHFTKPVSASRLLDLLKQMEAS